MTPMVIVNICSIGRYLSKPLVCAIQSSGKVKGGGGIGDRLGSSEQCSVNTTTEGVVRAPLEFSMT